MDPVKRQEAVYEAQNIYARELPAISLYYPTWYYAYNPDAGVEWFYTLGGIAKGIPIPQNKMAMIGSHAQERGEIMQAVAAMQTTDDTQDTPMMPFFAVFAILTVFFLKRSGRKT